MHFAPRSFPVVVVVVVVVIVAAACGTSPALPDAHRAIDGVAADSRAIAPWRVPAGWTHESINFPLAFAPSVTHLGVEELRFAPGVFDPYDSNYWSYAFAWRLSDSAVIEADQLGLELTAYYRGLMVSADTHHAIMMPDAIVAHASDGAHGFALTAHLFDAFNNALPVDLAGTAQRVACGTGALWVFVMSPLQPQSPMRTELDQLAAEARCGQPPL